MAMNDSSRNWENPGFLFLCYKWNAHGRPQVGFPLEKESGRIQLVKTLHYQDDGTCSRLVEPGVQGAINPIVHVGSFSIAHRLIGTDWVIEDCGVASAAHGSRAHAGRDHVAAPVIGILGNLVAVARKLEPVSKEPLEPR